MTHTVAACKLVSWDFEYGDSHGLPSVMFPRRVVALGRTWEGTEVWFDTAEVESLWWWSMYSLCDQALWKQTFQYTCSSLHKGRDCNGSCTAKERMREAGRNSLRGGEMHRRCSGRSVKLSPRGLCWNACSSFIQSPLTAHVQPTPKKFNINVGSGRLCYPTLAQTHNTVKWLTLFLKIRRFPS
jgi:hypothetical protein